MSGTPAKLGKISNRYLTDNLKCLNMQKKIFFFLVSLWNHEHGQSLAEHGGSLAKQLKPKDKKLNLFLKKSVGNPYLKVTHLLYIYHNHARSRQFLLLPCLVFNTLIPPLPPLVKYLLMCEVYTDVVILLHVCPPVCKITHSLLDKAVWIFSTYRQTSHGITITQSTSF